MKKYYTPEIEEFYVGFEYEELIHYFNYTIQESIQEWKPCIFEFDDLVYGIHISKDKTVTNPSLYLKMFNYEYTSWQGDKVEPYRTSLRVKYLDKEDIESLGFTITDEELKSYGYYLKGFIGNTELWYAFLKNKNDIYITLKNKHYNGNAKFHIKNKSELKRILKQLQI